MSLRFEPNLEQARRNSGLAHRILVKLKTIDLEDQYDDQLAKLCTDIADLWGAQLVFGEILNRFLEESDQWDSTGDDFVDMLSNVQHMSWHIDSIKEPLQTFAEYSYSRSESTSNLSHE
jgi:hypothetical protein